MHNSLLVLVLATSSFFFSTALPAATPYLTVSRGASCDDAARGSSGWVRTRRRCELIAAGRGIQFEDEANATLPPGCYESFSAIDGGGSDGSVGNRPLKMFFNMNWAGRESCTWSVHSENDRTARCVCSVQCHPGTVFNNNSYNSYSNEATGKATATEPNNNNKVCEPCAPGMFWDGEVLGAASCKPCGKGKYQPGTGRARSSACKSCGEQAAFSSQKGQALCQPCPGGKYNDYDPFVTTIEQPDGDADDVHADDVLDCSALCRAGTFKPNNAQNGACDMCKCSPLPTHLVYNISRARARSLSHTHTHTHTRYYCTTPPSMKPPKKPKVPTENTPTKSGSCSAKTAHWEGSPTRPPAAANSLSKMAAQVSVPQENTATL